MMVEALKREFKNNLLMAFQTDFAIFIDKNCAYPKKRILCLL
jgi:hypothetical protein